MKQTARVKLVSKVDVNLKMYVTIFLRKIRQAFDYISQMSQPIANKSLNLCS